MPLKLCTFSLLPCIVSCLPHCGYVHLWATYMHDIGWLSYAQASWCQVVMWVFMQNNNLTIPMTVLTLTIPMTVLTLTIPVIDFRIYISPCIFSCRDFKSRREQARYTDSAAWLLRQRYLSLGLGIRTCFDPGLMGFVGHSFCTLWSLIIMVQQNSPPYYLYYIDYTCVE